MISTKLYPKVNFFQSFFRSFQMMFLVPFMSLDQLISNFRIFETNMSLNIELSENFMNLLYLLLSWDSPISAIKITDNQIIIVSTIFLQNFLISIVFKFFVGRGNTYELDHFMNHYRFLASFFKIYFMKHLHCLCLSKSGTLSITRGYRLKLF